MIKTVKLIGGHLDAPEPLNCPQGLVWEITHLNPFKTTVEHVQLFVLIASYISQSQLCQKSV